MKFKINQNVLYTGGKTAAPATVVKFRGILFPEPEFNAVESYDVRLEDSKFPIKATEQELKIPVHLSPDQKKFQALTSNAQDELRTGFLMDSTNAIYWSCGTSDNAHLRRANDLATLAGISTEQALNHINYEDCPRAHDLKAYILISESSMGPEFLMAFRGWGFDVEERTNKQWQINSRAITEFLITETGILPSKKGRSLNERIQN